MHFLSVRLPNELAGGRFHAVDGRHDFATRPSVWPAPPALPPYPSANEGIGLPGIDSMGCWSW